MLACVFYTCYVILMQRVRGGLGAWTTLGLSSAATLPVLLGAAVALGEVVMPVDWTPLVELALSSQVGGKGLLIWASIGRTEGWERMCSYGEISSGAV